MTLRVHAISHICLSQQRIQELRYLQGCCNEIQIAFVNYKLIMESLVLPLFLAVATILSSVGLFTVIKFFGEMGIFISILFSIGETLCISVTSLQLCKASSICDKSELMQKELCHLHLVPKRKKQELKVILKSIRPIRFRIGSFFPVSKQSATDFLETLCSWLTTLLLTWG
ncbi:uncharacterized protein LOC118436437 [Folsomia candida]|uniref:uncharacterized protein LOC118436437 n=1 Tax=Folsomia candida TaxID=158441 RepID=UPI001604FE0B|nr:uncharacterized protein LOC118436437 [Folsomia candida]